MDAVGGPPPVLVVVPRRPGPLILPPTSDPADWDEALDEQRREIETLRR
jgi:hypothetical protein